MFDVPRNYNKWEQLISALEKSQEFTIPYRLFHVAKYISMMWY